jgi:aminoglycoside phosphotransferase (APT) family kinase protein
MSTESPAARLVAWLQESSGASRVEVEGPVGLGGFSGDAQRVDAVVEESGIRQLCSFVVKRPPTWSAEATVLRLLRDVPLPPGRVPELILEGHDDDGPWIAARFVPGEPIASEGILPDRVFDTLARIHAEFLGSPRLSDLPPLDFAWWTQLCEWLAQSLEAAIERTKNPGLIELRPVVRGWRHDSRIERALRVLPRTLVHRDMHHGNVVVGESAAIIDWGEAKQGPPYVDLPNVTTRESSGMAAYEAAWRDATGADRDRSLDDIGWAWGRAQVMVQYLPFGLSHRTPDVPLAMAANVTSALVDLDAALVAAQA